MSKTKLYPIDFISFGYYLFSIIYISLGQSRVENAGTHLLAFSGITFISFLIIKFYKEDSSKFLKFIRFAYPLFFLPYYFNVSTLIDRVIFTAYLDPFFQHLDFLMFGYQPAIEWGMKYDHILIQELFHFAYFSYYLVIPMLAFLIYFRKWDYFPKYIFTVMFVFYICYITYSLIPVVGARYWEELYELTMTYRGGLFTRIMAFIYSHSQHRGAAFPSSHVAINLIVNFTAFRYSPKLGKLLLPLSFLLIIATVYCHYHYFIDSLFGIIYAVALFKPAEMLYETLTRKMLVIEEETGSQTTTGIR